MKNIKKYLFVLLFINNVLIYAQGGVDETPDPVYPIDSNLLILLFFGILFVFLFFQKRKMNSN